MLSWATESLIEDGRSMSDIKQGVTLEVMGEGTSMGPLSDEMKQSRDTILSTADINYDIEWTTLGEYLEYWNIWSEGTSMGPLSDEMKKSRDTILSTARVWRLMSRLSWARQRCASTPPVMTIAQ